MENQAVSVIPSRLPTKLSTGTVDKVNKRFCNKNLHVHREAVPEH